MQYTAFGSSGKNLRKTAKESRPAILDGAPSLTAIEGGENFKPLPAIEVARFSPVKSNGHRAAARNANSQKESKTKSRNLIPS